MKDNIASQRVEGSSVTSWNSTKLAVLMLMQLQEENANLNPKSSWAADSVKQIVQKGAMFQFVLIDSEGCVWVEEPLTSDAPHLTWNHWTN